jgi:hypothetical protein
MGAPERPTVVCICGSSRFKDDHLGIAQRETLLGKIVLLAGFYHHVDKVPITAEQKKKLDQLHCRKIDIADEVFIVNPNGYVGESTKEQIEYARALGKTLRWLEDPNVE